jgi:nucleotide-binding universal stress UspA family protein
MTLATNMNIKLQRFIAATDFSEQAVWAAQRAALLAAQHGARLELLHVVAKAPLNALRELLRARPKSVANLMEDVREALADTAAALARSTGASVTTRVEIGEVLHVITRRCSRADLLVLGARGTSPMRDAILGTTAERLLGKCPTPMLIVKRRPVRRYRNPLVGIDFSRASKDALRMALRLAPQATVTAIHAYDVPFEGKLHLAGVRRETIDMYRHRAAAKSMAELRALGERVTGKQGQIAHRVGHGYPPHLIRKAEQVRHADLVALGKQKRPALQEFLLGRVTRHILADSRSDVLVVPA